MRNLVTGLAFLALQPAFAQECGKDMQEILFEDCHNSAKLQLKFHPQASVAQKGEILRVAGTYSSADRFGVEGLAIGGGQLISGRFQNWDGVLLISPQGIPQIFDAKNVQFGDLRFNLKTKSERKEFIAQMRQKGWASIQSHLLILNGSLDVSPVEGAPIFKRRLLYVTKVGWGIYETRNAVTLYEGGLELHKALAPEMAINLDMGAYNFCERQDEEKLSDCGSLLINANDLTNVLAVRLKEN